MKSSKLLVKFKRSKIFPELVYSKQIPNKIIICENGKFLIKNGIVHESLNCYENGKKILGVYSRLDNAKLRLQQLANL